MEETSLNIDPSNERWQAVGLALSYRPMSPNNESDPLAQRGILVAQNHTGAHEFGVTDRGLDSFLRELMHMTGVRHR